MFSDALLLLFLVQSTATAAVLCTTKNRYIVVLSERYKTGLLNFCLSKSVLCKPSFSYYTTIEVSLSESHKHFFSCKIGLFQVLQTILEFREQQWVVFLRSIFFIVRYSKYQVYDFVNSRTQLITPDLGFAQNTNWFFFC